MTCLGKMALRGEIINPVMTISLLAVQGCRANRQMKSSGDFSVAVIRLQVCLGGKPCSGMADQVPQLTHLRNLALLHSDWMAALSQKVRMAFARGAITAQCHMEP